MISSYPLHLRPGKCKSSRSGPQDVKIAGSWARQPVSTAARATCEPGHRSVPVNWGWRRPTARAGRPAGAAPPSGAPQPGPPLPVVAAPGSDAPSWACGRRRAQVSRARLARVHAPLSCGPRALTPRVAVARPCAAAPASPSRHAPERGRRPRARAARRARRRRAASHRLGGWRAKAAVAGRARGTLFESVVAGAAALFALGLGRRRRSQPARGRLAAVLLQLAGRGFDGRGIFVETIHRSNCFRRNERTVLQVDAPIIMFRLFG